MKELAISKGLNVLLDDEDYEKYHKFKWYAQGTKNHIYAARSVRYGPHKENKKKCLYLHRLILNCKEDEVVDHIDHNTLNNQKYNLRLASHKENIRNRKNTYCKKDTAYKGVFKQKGSKTWGAQIVVNYKRIIKSGYKTQNEAAIAYNELAIEHFGEFALLNKILDNRF